MKATKIHYSIPDPCGKSWNDMTPESTGRFCGSCEKSVIDFTAMSDFSIVNYLEEHKNEKVCGRFTKPQLERVYSLNQPVFAPAFDLRTVVLGLALTTFSAIHGFAQTETPEPLKIDTTTLIQPLVIGTIAYRNLDHTSEKKAQGKIRNHIADFKTINVVLKTEDGTILETIHPDAKGKFEFNLDWKLKPAFIEISGVGYERQELHFSTMRQLSNIEVILPEEIEMIRGEVIQGDIKQVDEPEEDRILQKVEMGNVSIRKTEK
ncbi:hypothetical protein [Fluviicola sp.]|uniref:hypothetical protein n=1 Tax=Fluviicola sp. TaxID=1917219 RepID=UPI0031D5327A